MCLASALTQEESVVEISVHVLGFISIHLRTCTHIGPLVFAESHLDQRHKGQGVHPPRPAPAAVRAASGDMQHRSPSQEDEI